MTSSTLSFSIDLDAELRSMTERQHLNAVHFTVQLIRHALRHAPTKIQIRSSRDAFVVEHNGRPFGETERGLLFEVMHHADQQQRQRALAHLERDYGVDLLSLLLQSDRVVVESATSFEAQSKRLTNQIAKRGHPSSGYRITVYRKRKSRRQEKKEITFYAKHADAELRLNGRRINRKIKTENAFGNVEVYNNFGLVKLGLAKHGEVKRIRFYKHGIYYGVRSNLPSDGLATDGYANSKRNTAEDNFRESVRDATELFRRGRDVILEEIAGSFHTFTPKSRKRVKHLVLNLVGTKWTEGLTRLALFDCVGAPSVYSLSDLRDRARGQILFYAPKAAHNIDDIYLPRLDEEEANALTRLLRVPVRPVLAPRRPSRFRWLRKRRSHSRPAEDFEPVAVSDAASVDLQEMARALYLPQVFTLTWADEDRLDHCLKGTRVCLRPNRDDVRDLVSLAGDRDAHAALRAHLFALVDKSGWTP